MRVLLTNDDGIYSPGLAALAGALGETHEVWTVAPDGERSGTSNAITISEPIRCTEVGERRYAVSGTPTDCVILATLGAIPVSVDVVISGINVGPNLGSDVIYSGTCAAARQAAYKRIPAIATSLNTFRPPFHFDPFARWLTRHLDDLIGLWDEGHFININAPNLVDYRGVRVCEPAMRRYSDHLLPFKPPRGGTYYFVDGAPEPVTLVEGTDWHAVDEGYLAVSPILLNPINDAASLEAYRRASLEQ